MITEEELMETLLEVLDTDMSDGTRQYLAEALLEKYVVLERQLSEDDVTVDDGWVSANGDQIALLSRDTAQDIAYRLDGREIPALLRAAARVEALALTVAFLRRYEGDAKAERREEISKEMGHPVYMYAPQVIKTLIARLVDEEFKNVRD